ncbi:MAG: hypothetical protein ACUVV0_17390, partial [Anaerolineae bacterium]
ETSVVGDLNNACSLSTLQSLFDSVKELIKTNVYYIFRSPFMKKILSNIKTKILKCPENISKHNQTLQNCYQDIVTHRKKVLKKTSGELFEYMTELDKSFSQQSSIGNLCFLEREYENYVHLLYLLTESARVNNEKQSDS